MRIVDVVIWKEGKEGGGVFEGWCFFGMISSAGGEPFDVLVDVLSAQGCFEGWDLAGYFGVGRAEVDALLV